LVSLGLTLALLAALRFGNRPIVNTEIGHVNAKIGHRETRW